MYKLVAIAIEDGWAYILKDKNYYLIRPPYIDLKAVDSKEIDYAISFLGYLEIAYNNKELEEIIKYIKKKSEIFYQNKEDLKITSEEIDEYFEYSSEEDFRFLFDCINKNLILEGKIPAARSFITDIDNHKSSKKYYLKENIKEMNSKCDKAVISLDSLKKYDLANVNETFRIQQKKNMIDQ